METTYLIDSNILVYAYNEDVEFHEKALEILENALNKRIDTVISDKNLYEFFAIITDKKRVENPVTIERAIEIINFLVDSNIKIIYSSPFVLSETLTLIGKYKIKKQEVFDLNLVALMIKNKIDTIISANDQHFKNIEEINVFNPFKQPEEKITDDQTEDETKLTDDGPKLESE